MFSYPVLEKFEILWALICWDYTSTLLLETGTNTALANNRLYKIFTSQDEVKQIINIA